MKQFDVVVIGAGTAGESIAETLSRAGRSVALIEKLRVGGECAYVSCMPSKAMLRSAQIRKLAKNAVAFGGSSTPLIMDSDNDAFHWAAARRDRIADYRDDSASSAAVKAVGIALFRGSGFVTGPNLISINQMELGWKDLVIATGSLSTIPKIEGLETVDSWTSAEALSAGDCPRSVLIIGGGPVGCELAQIFTRFGSETTLVQSGPQLADNEHFDVAARLAENLEDDGVTILLNTEVLKVEVTTGNQTLVHLSNGSYRIVERIIIASGRHPDTTNLGLRILGIEVDKNGTVLIDEHCRVVGQRHVWAAGDVTGIAPFTHTASYQGHIVSSNLLGMEQVANYVAIPRAIYTDPPVASVGKMADSMNREGYLTASIDLKDVSRTITDGEAGGLLVLTADPVRGVLVGASAIGPHADEWMAEASLAIRAEIQLSLWCDVVHAFPTYGQAFETPLKELASQIFTELLPLIA